MTLRRHLLRFASAGFIVGSGFHAAAVPLQDSAKPSPAPSVITKMEPDDLESLIKAAGYPVKRAEKGDALIVTLDNVKTVFRFTGNRESMQVYVGFQKAEHTSLKQMNTWNKEHRFGCAYLDDQGDPCVKLDLDLAGGVSREHVKEFILTAREVVNQFAADLSEAEAK